MKSNIGHQESGSGIAALIKVILSLEKGVIPPVSDNFHSVNPAIDVEYYNLKVIESLINIYTHTLTWLFIFCSTGCFKSCYLAHWTSSGVNQFIRVRRYE